VAKCIHPAPPLQPHLPSRICPITLYLDLWFIDTAWIVSLPAYEPRPAISAS
jgi:hypothetical protein